MEITSTTNPKIKEIKALLAKKGRAEQQRFIVEGKKCVEEAVAFAPGLLKLLLVDKNDCDSYAKIMARAEELGAECYTVPASILEAVSDVKTPQGIAAVLSLPEGRIQKDARFLVALDNIQDPSNIGAILRTADAAGADGVILSIHSADPYAPKAIRASMGSVFHTGIIKTELAQKLKELKTEGFLIAGGDLSGEESFSFEDQPKICLVIGNEANGISEEILSLCQKRIRIPIYGRAESLNAAVAAGILLYKIAGYFNTGC